MTKPRTSMQGYVLAGGRSSRMAQDKALLEVEGEPLLQHALRRLQAVCTDVAILSGPARFERDALLSCYARLVPDTELGHAGPLAAVSAALDDCGQAYALLLAVDQPGIPVPALERLAAACDRAGVAAACFAASGRPEPLPMLVSSDLRHHLRDALAAGERRLLPGVQAAVAAAGRELLLLSYGAGETHAFLNLNKPEDLLSLRKRAATSNQSAPRASD